MRLAFSQAGRGLGLDAGPAGPGAPAVPAFGDPRREYKKRSPLGNNRSVSTLSNGEQRHRFSASVREGVVR